MFNGHVNKRGSLEDLFVIGLFIFFFAMLILVGYKIIDSFNTEIQASDVLEQHGKDASAELTSFFPGVIDNSFLFFVVGLGLVTFVSAALVGSPYFYWGLLGLFGVHYLFLWCV